MTGPVPGWNEGCRDDGPRADRGYLEFGQDEPQRLGGPGSGAPAAVADDPGGLAVPLPVDVVQGVLQGSGAGVVALGDEDAVDEGLRDSNPATKRRGRESAPPLTQSGLGKGGHDRTRHPAARRENGAAVRLRRRVRRRRQSRATPACAGARSWALSPSSSGRGASAWSGSSTNWTPANCTAARPRTTPTATSTLPISSPRCLPPHRPDETEALRVPRTGLRLPRPRNRQRVRKPPRGEAGRRGTPLRRVDRHRLQRPQPPGCRGGADPPEGAGSRQRSRIHPQRRIGGVGRSLAALRFRHVALSPGRDRAVPGEGHSGRAAGARRCRAVAWHTGAWARSLKRAEACWVPIAPGLTPHGLRHTHKTLMREVGTPPKLMDERMGHEDGSVQSRYDHTSRRGCGRR